MEVWRLLDTSYADGPTNMAVDEAILLSHARGRVPPTLRFYRWQPRCLSIGVFQSVGREVNLEECRLRGIDVVRRPTGGRAILHASEVTYSVAASRDNPFVSGSVSESYRKISAALAAGLRSLGADVQMAPRLTMRPGSGDERDAGACPPQHWPRTPACFDVPSDYELMVDGRKLVGSAQMRKHGAVLQHGSIILDVDVSSLLAVLQMFEGVSSERPAQALGARMIGLDEALGRKVLYHEVTQAIALGFRETASLVFVPGELTGEERALAARLREEKYLSPEWNYRR